MGKKVLVTGGCGYISHHPGKATPKDKNSPISKNASLPRGTK